MMQLRGVFLLSALLAAARGEVGRREGATFQRSAVAGGAAACAATVALHPVDTIKTLLQQASVQSGAAGSGLRATISQVGARGLYRGVTPAALSMMPACAVRMGAYESAKRWLTRQHETEGSPLRLCPPPALVAIASALSVCVSATVRAPLDMVKTQVQAGTSASASAALRTACRGGGLEAVRCLYTGAGIQLLRDIPFFTLNLLIYETLKSAAEVRRERSGDSQALSPATAILLGAIAQGCAGYATNPLDVLKTRVQAGDATSMARALRLVMKRDGLGGLMRGAGMRTAWIAPQGCVYYPVYELVLRLLAPADPQAED